MARSFGSLFLSAAIVAVLTGGCTRSVVKQKSPADPLLISKKPVTGREASTELPARADLSLPPLPPARTLATSRPAAAPAAKAEPTSGVRLSPPVQ